MSVLLACIPRVKYSSLFWFCALILCAQHGFAKYDDGARFAFTTSPAEKAVYVVDLHTHALVDTIQFELPPDSVSASENLKALVIAHKQARRLTLLDLGSSDLTRIDYPLDIVPDYISVSPLGETIAVYDRDRQILEVHAVRRKQKLLEADGIRTDVSFTFNLDGSTIYWVDQHEGTVNSVDLWSERESLGLGKPGELSAVTRSTDGLLGFISQRSTGVVHVINLKTFEKLKTFRVGPEPGRPWGTTDGSTMLVPNSGDGTVTAIATSTLQTLYTVPAVKGPVSINPGWLDSTAAVIGATGEVAFFDVATGKTQQRFKLEGQARQGIVTSDSKTLAIPLAGKGGVSFFDMRKRSWIAELGGLPGDIGEATLAISNNLCH